MPELDDQELLREFAEAHSEAAFTELVARYVNLVYSTALRFSGNPQHAEEVTQAVFIVLARKAASIGKKAILSGWLYQTARLTAANVVKSEIRRQCREQEAYMQSTLNEPDPAAWEQKSPANGRRARMSGLWCSRAPPIRRHFLKRWLTRILRRAPVRICKACGRDGLAVAKARSILKLKSQIRLMEPSAPIFIARIRRQFVNRHRSVMTAPR